MKTTTKTLSKVLFIISTFVLAIAIITGCTTAEYRQGVDLRTALDNARHMPYQLQATMQTTEYNVAQDDTLAGATTTIEIVKHSNNNTSLAAIVQQRELDNNKQEVDYTIYQQAEAPDKAVQYIKLASKNVSDANAIYFKRTIDDIKDATLTLHNIFDHIINNAKAMDFDKTGDNIWTLRADNTAKLLAHIDTSIGKPSDIVLRIIVKDNYLSSIEIINNTTHNNIIATLDNWDSETIIAPDWLDKCSDDTLPPIVYNMLKTTQVLAKANH